MSFVQCDVSSWESQADAFEKVYVDQGRIDIVFANAGISKEGKLIETDRAQRGEKPMKPDLGTLNVNLVGVIYCQYFHLSLLIWVECVVIDGKADFDTQLRNSQSTTSPKTSQSTIQQVKAVLSAPRPTQAYTHSPSRPSMPLLRAESSDS